MTVKEMFIGEILETEDRCRLVKIAKETKFRVLYTHHENSVFKIGDDLDIAEERDTLVYPITDEHGVRICLLGRK